MPIQSSGCTNVQSCVKLEEAPVRLLPQVGDEATVQDDDCAPICGGWEDNALRQLGNFAVLIYDTGLPMDPQTRIHGECHASGIPGEQNRAGCTSARWVNADATALMSETTPAMDQTERKRSASDLPNCAATNLLSGHAVSMWGLPHKGRARLEAPANRLSAGSAHACSPPAPPGNDIIL